MTTRLPVSGIQPNWIDAQQVAKEDMDVQQAFDNQQNEAIVQNFFGSGVLLENPVPRVLFDSDIPDATQAALIAAKNFDGTGITPALQPSDTNQGNQLAIELTGSNVFGRFAVYVVVIGVDFNGNIQYERFYFHRNDIQVTTKHYVRILSLLFNNFKGNNNGSAEWDGRIVVREAKPFELSRDTISACQDIEPNIFFRDFNIADVNSNLYNTLQTAIGTEFTADALDINVTGKQPNRSIQINDVTTQIGQKFQSTTNNLQKVTLLMGVERNTAVATVNMFDWAGTLLVSVYPLQTTVDCPLKPLPGLAINFDPTERPLAQLSFSQADLASIGYVLTDVAQPIDFVFTNTILASPGGLVSGNYYCVTFQRAGSANNGVIFAESGIDLATNTNLTVFSGTSWTDVSNEDLWFQVYSDACKFASGSAYDSGKGILSSKTATDPNNGSTIDNENRNFSFVNTGQNIVNTAILQAAIQDSQTTQDERTGDHVWSRQQYEPEFSFVTTSNLATLQQTKEPLIIGAAADVNPQNTSLISGTTSLPGLVHDGYQIVINPAADLLTNQLIGQRLVPDITNANLTYRIFKTTLCEDGYGDVTGSGEIGAADLTRLTQLIGESLSYNSTQTKILTGQITTLEMLRADLDNDGVITSNDYNLLDDYINGVINSFPAGSTFKHLRLDVQPAISRFDGYYNFWTPGALDPETSIADLKGYAVNTFDTGVSFSSLTTVEKIFYGNYLPVVMNADNSAFTTVPFVPVNYQIQYIPFWQPDYLILSSNAKQVPVSFSYNTGITNTSCDTNGTLFNCLDRIQETPTCDPGRNDYYYPDNLIIGRGQILNTLGAPYKLDLEIGTVILELPSTQIINKSIDLFTNFIKDRGDGFTDIGRPAMKYANCETVQAEDLLENRLRFSVSIQSITCNNIAADGYIGEYIDPTTGILRIWSADLINNPLFDTMISRIQILVFLKQAGWNNTVQTVPYTQLINLLY